MIIEHYSVEQGLPSNSVNHSLKDKEGFLWFGTWYGLCRFDGTKFRLYNKQEFGSLDVPPRKIQRIVEDKNGFIWVKTIDRKLYIFDKAKESFHAVSDQIKEHTENIQVIKIQTTVSGDVLLLTKNKNLLLVSTNKAGEIDVKTVFNSQGDINPRDYRLTHNVLNETEEQISWIGKDYKIASFSKGESLTSQKSNFILEQMNIHANHSLTACFDDGKRIWIGEESGVFYAIETQTGSVQKYVLSQLTGAITNLMVTPSEVVYLNVIGQGTYSYDLRERKLEKIDLQLEEELVTHAYVDQYDKIWFHENEKAIVYYDPIRKTSKRFPFTLTGKIGLLCIEDAGERGLFFLSPAGEAWLFDRNNLSMIPINGLKEISSHQPNQQFFHLLLDNNGVLWLSSTTQGVYRINFPKKQFSLFVPPTTLPTQNSQAPGVRALYQSKNGDIWVGTRWQNLYLLSSEGQLKYTFADGKNGFGAVYHLMEDNQKNLWISTKGNGLFKGIPDTTSLSGYQFIHYTREQTNPYSLGGVDAYFTYQDKKGRIWVGLLDGGLNLLCEEDGKVSFKNKENAFKGYPAYGLYMEVRNMIEDNNGRIWVGTMDGLISFDANFKRAEEIQFETYQNENRISFTDSDVYSVYKDSQHNSWICVFGGGLSKLVDYNKEKHLPTFKTYGFRDGLNNDVVISMVEDDDNRLWFATEGGVSYYDLTTEQIRNFDKYDGFPSGQIEDNTAIKTQEGEIWIGSREGVIIFAPNRLESYNSQYNTFIVDCQVSNQDIRSYTEEPITSKSITYTEKIVLKHNQAMFTFEFAALNFNNQNRVSYRYILEGYEKEWHYNGRNRIASYTNVPPGDYTFVVNTMDESNPGLDSSYSLHVVILPPWWATWWAYLIYLVIAGALLYLGLRLSFFTLKMKNDLYIGQKLSELKIRFFTNISHELRTPLTLIQGPVQELKSNEQLTPKGKEYISLMERSVAQMLELVNQILDFRKIQYGKMRLHVSNIYLNEWIRTFEQEFHVLAEEKKIEFQFHTEQPVRIWADKDKLGTVVRNLLSNAFKFTPAEGKISVEIGLCDSKERCYIKVKDSGEGIPNSKLSEIFNRFSQVENSHSAYYPGTGIGLALSKELIEMHKGELYAKSELQKGTEFIVELQLGKSHFNSNEVDFYLGEDETNTPNENEINSQVVSQEVMEKVEEVADNSLPSILLVEDNKELLNLLRMQLEEQYHIYTATDGAEGLKKVHLYHPDLIVTDQMMPNMTGTELLEVIRKDFQISHIPLIILTARGNDEAKTEAITKGANAYITKPFSKEYLVARIEQLLKERKLFRERVWKPVEQHPNKDSYEQFLEQKDVKFMEQIHQVIEENLENSEFNIDTIASTIGLSRSAFFKKLKSLTGFAPVDLVKEIRLNKSIELIKQTDLTVTEIAFAVGFKDSGYFSKCFRKKYNQSPREYLAEWRKK